VVTDGHIKNAATLWLGNLVGSLPICGGAWDWVKKAWSDGVIASVA
jgi:hypothetical protein